MTAASGVKVGYRNDFNGDPGANPKWDGHFAILDSLGGGLGLIDYNGDGLLDIFVAGGGYHDGPVWCTIGWPGIWADQITIKGHTCKLFKNLGNFQFKDVTKEVGLDQVPLFYNHGVAV